jgi:hypothetical protein
MTKLLEQAFAEAAKLPAAEQDSLASRLLAELKARNAQAAGWPPGYFESTFGSITDETFERPPQCGCQQVLVQTADELFQELDARAAANIKAQF